MGYDLSIILLKTSLTSKAWLVLFVVGIGVGVWGVLLEITIDGFEGARRGNHQYEAKFTNPVIRKAAILT